MYTLSLGKLKIDVTTTKLSKETYANNTLYIQLCIYMCVCYTVKDKITKGTLQTESKSEIM